MYLRVNEILRFCFVLWIASWKPLATWTPDHTLWRKSTFRPPRCTVEICRKTCVFFASLFVATKTFLDCSQQYLMKILYKFSDVLANHKFNLFVVATNFVFPFLMRYHSKWFCACVVDDCARFMPPVLDAVTMISEILRCEECKWAGGHDALISCHEKLQMTANSRLVCSSVDNIEFKVLEQFAVETKDAEKRWWMSRIVGGTTIKDTGYGCTCLSFVFKSSRKCAALLCSDLSQATHNGIYWAYSCTHSLAQRIKIAGCTSVWWCHRTSRRVYCVHVVSKWMTIVWECWTCNRKPPIDKRASCIGMLCENAPSLSHETRIRFAHCIGWENRGKPNPIIRHSLASMRERLGPLRHRTKLHLWSSQLPDLWWVLVNFLVKTQVEKGCNTRPRDFWSRELSKAAVLDRRHCGNGTRQPHQVFFFLKKKKKPATLSFLKKNSFSRGRVRLILKSNSFLLQKRSWKKKRKKIHDWMGQWRRPDCQVENLSPNGIDELFLRSVAAEGKTVLSNRMTHETSCEE